MTTFLIICYSITALGLLVACFNMWLAGHYLKHLPSSHPWVRVPFCHFCREDVGR